MSRRTMSFHLGGAVGVFLIFIVVVVVIPVGASFSTAAISSKSLFGVRASSQQRKKPSHKLLSPASSSSSSYCGNNQLEVLLKRHNCLLILRGGSSEEEGSVDAGDDSASTIDTPAIDVEETISEASDSTASSAETNSDSEITTADSESITPDSETSSPEVTNTKKFQVKEMMMVPLATIGTFYSRALERRPIVTKSVTACFIFALSDYLAQRLEPSDDEGARLPINWTRTISASLVGLLYFGPAAHYWYQTIFKLLPGTSLLSTLKKATLGQLIFGPSFTCIFFATSLMQSKMFTLRNWWDKIVRDLPTAWAAGLGFWPLVDLISYSFIDPQWIPLFVNTCSLIWTIYLSWIANRQEPGATTK